MDGYVALNLAMALIYFLQGRQTHRTLRANYLCRMGGAFETRYVQYCNNVFVSFFDGYCFLFFRFDFVLLIFSYVVWRNVTRASIRTGGLRCPKGLRVVLSGRVGF